MGLANKISARYCKKILTSFPDTVLENKKCQYVGSPIRRDLFNVSKISALQKFELSGDKPILLITGGSQGATTINTVVRGALDQLLKDFDVVHICGKGNLDKSIEKKGYKQFEFISNIQDAFAIASVCVTRAGSNTLFDLLSLSIPSVLIPLPKGASRGDQIENTNYFSKLGVVTSLPQENLTEKSLVYSIYSTFSNKDIIKKNLSLHPIRDCSRQISRIIADYKR